MAKKKEVENKENPQITITVTDGNINWQCNVPEATMLYYFDIIKQITLTKALQS